MWAEEEKAKKALYKIEKKGSKVKIGDDEEMKSDEESEKPQFAQHKPKKHQNLFSRNHAYNDYADEYDEEEDEDEESEDDADIHRENVFNQQNAFGIPVYAQKVPRYGGGYNN